MKSLPFEGRKSPSLALAPLPDSDTVPSWAVRKVSLKNVEDSICLGGQVTIQNEELTWEPFYASIENDTGSIHHENMLAIVPSKGNLAPRGGRNSYSDSCTLRVERREDGHHPSLTPSSDSVILYLVVRTEAQYWNWRIVVETIGCGDAII